MASAPTPTLNSTAPQVNLMAQFSHPSALPSQAGSGVAFPSFDFSGVLPVIFLIIFAIWAIYTLVVIYHWFRYRHKSWYAVPSIFIHLAMSGSIILYMISGLR